MAVEADFHQQAKAIGGDKWGDQLVTHLNAAGADGSGAFTTVVATTSGTFGTNTVASSTGVAINDGAGSSIDLSVPGGGVGGTVTVSGATTGLSLLGPSGTATIALGAAEASASSYVKRVYTKTAIADNTATAVITVTVPNAKHGGMLFLKIVGTNGSGECVNTGTGAVAICRGGAGIATVVTAATIAVTATAQDATGGADTNTLAYAVSAISGAAGAVQTFNVTVTLNDSGSSATNKAIVVAELVNFEGTGMTMAAAA
jgi:hypothetical protein